MNMFEGYSKRLLGDNYILLAGGGHRVVTLGNKNANDLASSYPIGLSSGGIYSNNYPVPYGNTFTSKNKGVSLIAVSWNHSITDDNNDLPTEMYIRGKRDVIDAWSTWTRVLTDRNSSVSLNGATLTVNIAGTEVSLTNTWRGMLNNLTTDSSDTTDSLSAYLGYLLANGSARDDTKLPLTGGVITGSLTINRTVKVIARATIADLKANYGLRNNYESAEYPTEEFLKAWCKYAYALASSYSVISNIQPNSRGLILADVYSDGLVTLTWKDSNPSHSDAELGLPIHITGRYYPHGGLVIIFGTVYGKWYYRTGVDSSNIGSLSVASATSATVADWVKLLKPISNTTTASASTWNIPSGCKQVWGERFSDSTLKYTPSGGSPTTITNTGDWTMWLEPNATSNAATLNMRIDGTYYGSFSGNLNGKASSVTVANSNPDALYNIVWHNGNLLYGNGNIRCNPYKGIFEAKELRIAPYGGIKWSNEFGDTEDTYTFKNDGLTIYQDADETSGIQLTGDVIRMWCLPDDNSIEFYNEDSGSLIWYIDADGYFSGTAGKANALSVARDLKVDLSSSTAQSFSGNANATSIGVSGILPFTNLPTLKWADLTITANGTALSTPTVKLLKIGTDSSDANGTEGFIRFYNETTGSTVKMYRYNDVFYITRGGDSTKGILINSSGNLGVGITPSYKLHVNGGAKIEGNITGTSSLDLKPASGEGGQINLMASTANTTLAGIALDLYNSTFRVFGIQSADGTTKTGVGTPLVIDPYEKTITGGYTLTGNLTGTASNVTVTSKDKDATYRIVFNSGSTLYNTSNIYCNPYSDYLYVSELRAGRVVAMNNWVGFYDSVSAGGKRYGFILGTSERMYFRVENGSTEFNYNGPLVPQGSCTYNLGTNTASWNRTFSRYIDTRHLDATAEYTGDMSLYIGYGSATPTQKTLFYYSTGTRNTSATSRTQFAEINKDGAYALTRFGVNGQNTSYTLYVNGTGYFTNQLHAKVAQGTAPLVVTSTTKVDKLNVSYLDGYSVSNVYKAASHIIANANTTNTWIRIATISLPDNNLKVAGFTAIFTNRESLDKTSFLLTLSIRRTNTSSVNVNFYYLPLQEGDPRTLTLRSDDNQNFYVYFLSEAKPSNGDKWTTYYSVTKIYSENTITFENVGVTSLISGSKTNVNASRGGRVLYALNSNYANGASYSTRLSNNNAYTTSESFWYWRGTAKNDNTITKATVTDNKTAALTTGLGKCVPLIDNDSNYMVIGMNWSGTTGAYRHEIFANPNEDSLWHRRLPSSDSGTSTWYKILDGNNWTLFITLSSLGLSERTITVGGDTYNVTSQYTSGINLNNYYLRLSGGAMSSNGLIVVGSIDNSSGGAYNGGIQLRERKYLKNNLDGTVYTDGPAITFHWSYRWVHILNMHSNDLFWDNNKVWHEGNDGSGTGLDADKVDGYHAADLWRCDGAKWNPSANVTLGATANNQEWSFDITRNGHTGCYWHVWDSAYGSMLQVTADDGKVRAPYGFVGNLSGTASNADTVDGYHADKLGTADLSARHLYASTNNNKIYYKIGTLPTTATTSNGESEVVFSLYNAINYGNNYPSKWLVVASSRLSYKLVATRLIGLTHIEVGYVISNNLMEIWVGSTENYLGKTRVEIHTSTNFTGAFTSQTSKPANWVSGSINISFSTENLNYTASGTKYSIKADSSNNLYVDVPCVKKAGDTMSGRLYLNHGLKVNELRSYFNGGVELNNSVNINDILHVNDNSEFSGSAHFYNRVEMESHVTFNSYIDVSNSVYVGRVTLTKTLKVLGGAFFDKSLKVNHHVYTGGITVNDYAHINGELELFGGTSNLTIGSILYTTSDTGHNNDYIRKMTLANFGYKLRDSGTLDSRYTKKTGDTATGTLSFRQSSSSNIKLSLWADNEGGNIMIYAPNTYKMTNNTSTIRYYQMDAYNGNFRLYTETNAAKLMTFNTSGELSTSAQGTLWGSSNDGHTNNGTGLDADLLDGLHGSYYHMHTARSYTSVNKLPSGSEGWYNIFTLSDSVDGAAICTIKAYAHSSLTFIVSKGYSEASTLQILQYNNSTNNSFFYIKGVRILSDGKVQALFNKPSANSETYVKVSINIFSSHGTLRPNSTLTLEESTLSNTSSPKILRSLNGTHNKITSDIVGSLSGNASTATTATSASYLSAKSDAYTSPGLGSNSLSYYNSNSSVVLSNTNGIANPTNSWYHHLLMVRGDANGYFCDVAWRLNDTSDPSMYFRIRANNSYTGWIKVLTDASPGSAAMTTTQTSYGNTSIYKILFTTTTPTSGGTINTLGYNNNFYVNSTGVYYSSDITLKDNIDKYKPYALLLDNPIRLFTWKDSTEALNIGFIAQEVEKWCPEAIGTSEDGTKTVNYKTALTALCSIMYDRILELEKEVKRLSLLV